jgi:hypothetical protein
MLMMALQASIQNPEGLQQLPMEFQRDIEASAEAGKPVHVVQEGMKKVTKQVKNQPTLDICDYGSLTIDPSCKGDLTRAQFIVYSFETSKSDLEKSGLYKNLDEIRVDTNSITTADSTENAAVEDTSFNFVDDPRKKFFAKEYWGFWDIDGSGVTKPIVATWVGDTIIRMEESPFPDQGLPFVSVQYLPKRKHVYGEPDGELLEDNQKISGAVTRGMLDILGRSAAGQTGIRKDALDVTNQRKFDRGMDYSFNPQIDPSVAFFTHKYPELPQSAPFMLQLQNNEAEAMSGVKAYSGGISGESLGKVATGVRGALDAASKRELGILRRLAKGMIQIARKITAMNAQFLSEEEVVRITDDEFVTIKRDDLAGNYDINMQISTAESDNAKAEELAFMLQTTGPNSDPGEVRLIRAEIARLRKMPELAKRIEEYEPQPDPMQQQMAMLEIKKLEAEIAEIESKTAENYAEARLDDAASREKDAKADKTNLDFVEQESGTQFERDIEKQGAQADANIEHEFVKAALAPKPQGPSEGGSEI